MTTRLAEKAVSEGNMTPPELKTIRSKLGLTQSGLAVALGLAKNGDRTVRRWEAGKIAIPMPVAIAVRSLITHTA